LLRTETYQIDVSLTAVSATVSHDSGLKVLTTTLTVDQPPLPDEGLASVVVVVMVCFAGGICLLLRAVLARLSSRDLHRGLSTPINGPEATLDDAAGAGLASVGSGGAGAGLRLKAIGCAATDRRRLKSLDVMRGVGIALFLFCDSGAGIGYAAFEPVAWVGLSVYEIAAGGAPWVIGFSLALTIDRLLGRHVTTAAVLRKAALRSVCLVALGLALNGGLGRARTLLVLGPLQRCALVYFSVGLISLATPKLLRLYGATDFAGGRRLPPPLLGDSARLDRAAKPTFCARVLHDLLPYALEFVALGAIVALYLLLYLGLRAGECPRGYAGPGGMYGDFGTHRHATCDGLGWPDRCCTGGVTGFVDWLLLGAHADGGTATMARSVFGAGSLSRFSLLGTAPAVLLGYLGFQAGRTLLHFQAEGAGHVLSRWCVWGALCGAGAAALHLSGTMLITPPLTNIPFVLAVAAVCFGAIAALHVAVDLLKIEAPFQPFRYLGLNPLPLFVLRTLGPNVFTWPASERPTHDGVRLLFESPGPSPLI